MGQFKYKISGIQMISTVYHSVRRWLYEDLCRISTIKTNINTIPLSEILEYLPHFLFSNLAKKVSVWMNLLPRWLGGFKNNSHNKNNEVDFGLCHCRKMKMTDS